MLSGTPALKATLPTISLCFILAILGIIVFTISSKALSRWMVKPIENTILSEKKFISNASHELKTPLSVISANAELLSSEVGRDNKHLLYIQQETSRMISLVQKMLTLTRLDAPQIQNTHAVFPVDDALLDIIYPMESVAFEKHIALSIDVQEQMKMDGNESQIQNLASILLNNALSYTPENGSIEIHAHIHNRKFYLPWKIPATRFRKKSVTACLNVFSVQTKHARITVILDSVCPLRTLLSRTIPAKLP